MHVISKGQQWISAVLYSVNNDQDRSLGLMPICYCHSHKLDSGLALTGE